MLMGRFLLLGWVLLGQAAGAGTCTVVEPAPGRTSADRKIADRKTDAGLCQVRPQTGQCECSLASLETTLPFAEAASVILLYYRGFPDEKYVDLLGRLLRECAAEELRFPPGPGATITQALPRNGSPPIQVSRSRP